MDSGYRLEDGKTQSRIDWWLFFAVIPILAAGLITMHSFTGDSSFATHQMIGIAASLVVFFVVSFADMRFLRSTWVSVTLFSVSVAHSPFWEECLMERRAGSHLDHSHFNHLTLLRSLSSSFSRNISREGISRLLIFATH
jgi:hypothetical protein